MTPSHRTIRLLWSPRSPFVRKVVWVAAEVGAMSYITTVPSLVAASRLNPDVMAINPLNKIPVLIVAADGPAQTICGSRLICEWLDHEFHGGLVPADFHARMAIQNLEVLGDGMLDLLIHLLEERQKPVEMRSQPHIDAYWTKLRAALDHLEAMPLMSMQISVGMFSIMAALSYMDFRFSYANWRQNRPALAAWSAHFSDRPSVRDNPFVDDNAVVLQAQI